MSVDNNLDDLYREIILEHYHDPHGRHEIHDADIRNEGKNPLCGDELALEIKLSNGEVEDIAVRCQGCAISVASGSMLTDAVKGKSLEEVKSISTKIKGMLKGEALPEDFDPEDLEALQGIRQFPVRIKCALLAWATLENGIKDYEAGKKETLNNITITSTEE